MSKANVLDIVQGRRHCFFMDSRGLVCSARGDLQPHKRAFAHDVPPQADLLAAVRALRPTALIGVSTVRGAFSAAVLQVMDILKPWPAALVGMLNLRRVFCGGDAGDGNS